MRFGNYTHYNALQLCMSNTCATLKCSIFRICSFSQPICLKNVVLHTTFY